MTCFCSGTKILTARGEVAVEELSIGDRVVTLTGRGAVLKPITWLGKRRIAVTGHPHPDAVVPVRIKANALIDRIPHRDLRLSPRHALYIDGNLIPAWRLLNGVTVLRETGLDEVDYRAVEIDGHDVLLADGMPAETYLEAGNRGFFEDAGSVTDEPDGNPAAAESFSPRQDNGAEVIEVKRRLIERVAALGYTIGSDADLRLEADGIVLHPASAEGNVHRFAVPEHQGTLRLVSASAVPADSEPANFDERRLGIAVSRIERSDGDERQLLDLQDDAAFTQGWHTLERDDTRHWRWTNGNAALPAVAPGTLDVTVDMVIARWLPPTPESDKPAEEQPVAAKAPPEAQAAPEETTPEVQAPQVQAPETQGADAEGQPEAESKPAEPKRGKRPAGGPKSPRSKEKDAP